MKYEVLSAVARCLQTELYKRGWNESSATMAECVAASIAPESMGRVSNTSGPNWFNNLGEPNRNRQIYMSFRLANGK